jgi:hypothetical protein
MTQINDQEDLNGITCSNYMQEVNQDIPIYLGEFTLKSKQIELILNGNVFFKWFPNSGVVFIGDVISGYTSDVIYGLNAEGYKLIIGDLQLGDCYITSLRHISKSSETYLSGTLQKEVIKGDKSIPVNKINFAVPNFTLELWETPVTSKINGNNSLLNQITFENKDFLIKIDKTDDFRDRKKELKSKGGYITLYCGALTKKKKGSILAEDVNDIFQCFSSFLTFLNGRKCSPHFRQGSVDKEVIWTDYSGYYVDIYKEVNSWPVRNYIEGYNDIWQKFYAIWNDPTRKGDDFLSTVIHWYVSANSNAILSIGSIIIAQTALELLYNWHVIEHEEMLFGPDGSNISASNKIRLLLSQLKVKPKIPDGLTELQAFAKKEKIKDGPEAFVYIRNAIVHSQNEKRIKLTSISDTTIYDALRLGLWYIELSLLYILNFQGKYSNRCSIAKWVGDDVEYVPWSPKGTA